MQRPWFKLIDTATTYANLAKNISFKFHPVSGKSKSKRNRNKFVNKRFLTNDNDNGQQRTKLTTKNVNMLTVNTTNKVNTVFSNITTHRVINVELATFLRRRRRGRGGGPDWFIGYLHRDIIKLYSCICFWFL